MELTYDPKEINLTFEEYYEKLYQSEICPNRDMCCNFLSKINMPKLEKQAAQMLETLITLKELQEALIKE